MELNSTTPIYNIVTVRSRKDLDDTIKLFYEYADSLGFDISFQDFPGEMASMPGQYSPPSGELLLARNPSGTPIGCVAVRPLYLSTNETQPTSTCEMKRLYVSPSGRGLGLGKALAIAIIDIAKRLGYGEMKLDSVPQMTVAIGMYETLGFKDVAAYYATPLKGTRFLGLNLEVT